MDSRKTVLIIVNNVVGAALGLVALFFVGRYLGPAALGMVGFGLALIGLGDIFGNLGLRAAHIKRVSEGQDAGDCVATFLRLKLALGGAATLVMTAGVLWWHYTKGFQDATNVAVLGLLLVNFFLTQVRSIFSYTFKALRLTALAERIVLADTVLRVVATVVVSAIVAGLNERGGPLGDWPERFVAWLGLQGPVDVDGAAFLLAGAYLVGVIGSFLLAAWSFRRQGPRLGRYDPALARSYIRFAAPLAMLAVLAVVANRLDTVMIGYFWTASDVGHYYAAQRYAVLVTIIPGAVATLFFPIMSELSSQRAMEGVHEVAWTAQRLLSMTILPVLVVLLLLPAAILHVFVSDEFLPGAPILALLGVHGALLSYTVVSSSIVKGFDRPRAAAVAGALSVGLNAILNLVLIPDSILGVPLAGMKGTGAAIGTVLSQVVALGYLAWQARRVTGRVYVGTYLVRHVAAAAWAGLLLWAGLALWGQPDRWWELAGASAAAVVLYVSGLALTRELTRRDVKFFWDLMHVGAMVDYVRGEFALRRDPPK